MKYNKPTIIEALCEFRFIASENWDSTLYGAFWQEIKADYPDKEERKKVSVELKMDPAGTHESSVLNENVHMLFRRSDKKLLVQLQPNVLTINVLAPYLGWETFLEKICQAYENFNKLGEFSLERVGLRYLNRMRILEGVEQDKHGVSESEYISKAILNHSESVYSQVSVPIKDSRLQVTVATEARAEDSLIVDIDSSKEFHSLHGGIKMSSLLDGLHRNLIDAFETSITDELRQVMGESDVL